MTRRFNLAGYEHLRSRLHANRIQCELTQADLAAKLTRPQSFVSKYESGERRLDAVEFLEVCKALGVDYVALSHEIFELIK
jgi:transcriptional regulator with XRE-family HTH domain